MFLLAVTEEQALHQLYLDEQFGAINKDNEEEKNKYVITNKNLGHKIVNIFLTIS